MCFDMCVTSNQTFASYKTFILWILINSDKRSAVSGSWYPGTSALLEKGLYRPGTDECYQMVQHSSTMGLINMQWRQLQGSSQ